MISNVEREDVDKILYGDLEGRKPIRCLATKQFITWYPKANQPQSWDDEDALSADRYGVWGGTVEGYGRGFNDQKVWLHFVGIDIDWKNDENQRFTVEELHQRVRMAPHHCSIRTSSGGNGLHLFLHIMPVECVNKRQAQLLATALGNKYVMPHLKAVDVTADKVACNQLWVLGGKQRWLAFGPNKVLTAEDLVLPDPTVAAAPETLNIAECGPICRRFIKLLETTGAAKQFTHLTLIKRAVEGTEFAGAFEDFASGNNFDEHNTSISAQNGAMVVYSFRHKKTLLSLPLKI